MNSYLIIKETTYKKSFISNIQIKFISNIEINIQIYFVSNIQINFNFSIAIQFWHSN
jgi:hypothetical protein